MDLSGLMQVRCAATEAPAQPEPFAREAKFLTESKTLGRDVRVMLEGVDKYNNLFGQVPLYPSTSLTLYPSTPLSLCPSTPFHPSTPFYPSTPLPLYTLLPLYPSTPLPLYTLLPLYPSTPPPP